MNDKKKCKCDEQRGIVGHKYVSKEKLNGIDTYTNHIHTPKFCPFCGQRKDK